MHLTLHVSGRFQCTTWSSTNAWLLFSIRSKSRLTNGKHQNVIKRIAHHVSPAKPLRILPIETFGKRSILNACLPNVYVIRVSSARVSGMYLASLYRVCSGSGIQVCVRAVWEAGSRSCVKFCWLTQRGFAVAAFRPPAAPSTFVLVEDVGKSSQ